MEKSQRLTPIESTIDFEKVEAQKSDKFMIVCDENAWTWYAADAYAYAWNANAGIPYSTADLAGISEYEGVYEGFVGGPFLHPRQYNTKYHGTIGDEH
jgi:hypothetical protein